MNCSNVTETDAEITTTAINTNNLSETNNGTMPDSMKVVTIIVAVIGAAVAIVIIATTILCIAILMKKNSKRIASVDLPSTGSEKSPSRDGYINALYDSKSEMCYDSGYTCLSYHTSMKGLKDQSIASLETLLLVIGSWEAPTRALLVSLLANTHLTTTSYSVVCGAYYGL